MLCSTTNISAMCCIYVFGISEEHTIAGGALAPQMFSFRTAHALGFLSYGRPLRWRTFAMAGRYHKIMRHVGPPMFQCMLANGFAVVSWMKHLIRHSVPPATLQTLVVVLMLSRLDFGNAMLIGLPAYHLCVGSIQCRCGSKIGLIPTTSLRSHH